MYWKTNGDKFIIEFILKGGTSGIRKCDICNLSISLDVNDYIVHIQKSHSNLINKSLIKYIKDKYVVSVLLGKSIYKTSFFYSTCQVCHEEIEGFEELREHMLEHKKMNNAYKGFFGNTNPHQVKKEVLETFQETEEGEQVDSYSTFFGNSKNTFSAIKNNYYNNYNNCINSKNKVVQQTQAKNKEEALEDLTNLLKNVNEALIIKNPYSPNEKYAKDLEIKLLKEKLDSMESKLHSMETQYKNDLLERDSVTGQIQSIMSHKNYNKKKRNRENK